MAISLFLNKIKADIYNKPITRKIQIGEVSEVAERKSSFSYTIKLPMTSTNKRIFEMLGTVGNTSRKPYEEIVADYVVDTVYLVQNGSAIIRETSGEYQVNIIDGVRSLAESLKGKNLIDLPLDDLNHVLTTQAYIDSYSNTEGFIYGIANYGRGVTTSVKVEKQAPSIFTHTLFRRIFESNGLTLQGEFFNTNDKYLTEVVTPSRGYEVEFATLVSESKGGAESNFLSDYQFSNEYIDFQEKFTLSDNGLVGASIVSGSIEFSVAGTYKIDLSVLYSLYETYASIVFKINGSSKSYTNLEQGNSQTKTKSITFTVEAGDVVSLYISGSSAFDYEDPVHGDFTINYSASVDVSLYLQTGGQLIQASDYIGDVSQLDFLKDVVNRYGLVLHPVQNTGEFKFKRLEALLNDRTTAEDWTSKLAGISSEKYVSGYSKTNKANYQYPEATVVPTHDGEMLIDNENADEEKTMFSSPFEIPVKGSTFDGENVYDIPIWSVGEPEDVTVETELNHDEIVGAYLRVDGSVGVTEFVGVPSLVTGFYLYNTGEWVDYPARTTIVFDVEGVVVDLYASAVVNGVSTALAVYFDESMIFLGYEERGITSNVFYDRFTLTRPVGTKYVALCNNSTVDYAVLESQPFGYVVKKYENIDASVYDYKASGLVELNDNAFVCFYDVNDNFISYQYQGYGTEVERTKSGLYLPSNCRIIRVSGKTTIEPSLFSYAEIQVETAVNEETPLKVLHVSRVNSSVTAKFFDEVTGITVSENVPVLTLDFISMQYFLGNFYKAFQNMIENYKKVSLKMNLSIVDVFNLDFFRLKYLKQTGRFYYLNSVQHTTGKQALVEAIEIKEFPQNQPPSQLSGYSFEMNHESTRALTESNLTTGFEDPELDDPLKVKIISGFNSNILLKQGGVEITSETEINFEDLALTAVEVLGGLEAYSESWVFAVADAGSGSFGTVTAVLTASVRELINQPPVARAGNDQTEEQLPPEFPYEIYFTLNGSASYDYTGDIISYFWEIVSKPANSDVVLGSQNASTPTASLEVSNNDDNVGEYVLRLTVTDEFGATDTDEMTVTVNMYHP